MTAQGDGARAATSESARDGPAVACDREATGPLPLRPARDTAGDRARCLPDSPRAQRAARRRGLAPRKVMGGRASREDKGFMAEHAARRSREIQGALHRAGHLARCAPRKSAGVLHR